MDDENKTVFAEVVCGIALQHGAYLHHESDYRRRKDPLQYLVVHCAATPPTFNGGAREIREWHIHERGWMDIGYHFVIRRDGLVERGRPPWAEGAGATGHNGDSIHLCLVGGVDKAGPKGKAQDNFTEKQKAALAFLLKAFGNPSGGWLPRIQGHRDFPGVLKDCPSFDVQSWWLSLNQSSIPVCPPEVLKRLSQ